MSKEGSQNISIRIHEKLSNLSTAASNEQCIFKVYDELQSQDKEAYEPRVISIGPYHYGKRNLKRMEAFKLKYLKDLLDKRGEENVKRYLIALTEVKHRARRCYAEEINLGDDEFVEMMCLDGCFIIEFLRKVHKGSSIRDDSIFQKGWMVINIFRDLLLFENQIPFFILKKLFEMTKGPDDEDDIIRLGLGLCTLMNDFKVPEEYATKISAVEFSSKTSADEVSHLLHLVYKGWCLPFAETISQSDGLRSVDLSLESMKSTTELRKSGVRIRSATEFKSWLHITFEDGIIKIPHLEVNDFTETILRNLIAYELYTSNLDSRCYVTDYVKFLDILIDTARDVRKLQRHGIIDNQFGDDEVVAKMFNKLLRDITINDWMFCYSEVVKDVKEYSSSCWHRLRANCVIWFDQLMTNYFSSPWSVISFLAALVLLMLTVVQTIFSILQVKGKGK